MEGSQPNDAFARFGLVQLVISLLPFQHLNHGRTVVRPFQHVLSADRELNNYTVWTPQSKLVSCKARKDGHIGRRGSSGNLPSIDLKEA